VGINQDYLDFVESDIGEYYVRVLVIDKKSGFKWNFICVYGDAQRAGKLPF
jgi:hypothetical protein